MCESRQSGYDINYFDISSAKANAISLSPLAFRIHRRGADLSLYPFQSDGGCFFNSREEGTDGRGLCCGDLQEVNRKKKKWKGRDTPLQSQSLQMTRSAPCPVPGVAWPTAVENQQQMKETSPMKINMQLTMYYLKLNFCIPNCDYV